MSRQGTRKAAKEMGGEGFPLGKRGNRWIKKVKSFLERVKGRERGAGGGQKKKNSEFTV